MTRRFALLLSLIVLASGVLGSLTLTRGHVWGDDFAAYIMQAQSIVDGRIDEFIQRNTFAVSASAARFGPVTAPWGFPVLLAPVYAVFGVKLLAFKLVITACYMAFLAVFYYLADATLSAADSLLLTAVMAFHAEMLRAQNEVLSDIPFLFLSTLGLWLITRLVHEDPGSWRSAITGAATGLVAAAAAVTRMNGFLLLLALGLAQWISYRDRIRKGGMAARTYLNLAVPYLVFGLGFAVQAALLPSSGGGLREQFAWLTPDTIWHNLVYYFWLPKTFLAPFGGAGTFAYLILLLFFAVGAVRSSRADAPILVYALATLGLYVVFPGAQGLRYLFPILPILLLFTFRGMRLTAQKVGPPYGRGALALVYVFWIGFAVYGLGTAIGSARNNLAAGRSVPGGWQAGPYSAASQAAFAFIREQTPADSTVIFFKPRAMRLFTDRDSFVNSSCEALVKADYVVLVNDNDLADQIPPDQISQCQGGIRLVPVYRQQGFMAYQILQGP